MDYFLRVQGLFLQSAGTISSECKDYFHRVQGLFSQSASTIFAKCKELLKDETAIIKVRPMIPKNRKESAWKCLVRMEGEGAMGRRGAKIVGLQHVVAPFAVKQITAKNTKDAKRSVPLSRVFAHFAVK
jgi:hypothetical protein